MNMISGQIKELRNYERIFNGDRIDGNLSPIFGNAANTIEELSEKLKNGGWIPCSERLPEVEQTVLLSLRSLDVSVGFRANTDRYFYTEGEGYVLYENVLAWQPLPEAYHE